MHGRLACGKGHQVTCPKCPPGVHFIVEGAEERTVYGTPIALEGMLTSCGATLIASQNTARVEVGEDAGVGFGAARPLVATDADVSREEPTTYDQQFHVHDAVGGQPLAHRRYRVTIDGKTFEGVTDSQGRTRHVSARSALSAKLEVFPEGA